MLSSTSAFRVVFLPSLVSISPPKPSRAMTSPTTGLGALEVEPLASSNLAFLPLTASLTLAAALATLEVFLGGGGGAASGALRFRSSTGMAISRSGEVDWEGEATAKM